MPEQQALYFILALVALGLIFMIIPGQNLFAAVQQNLSEKHVIVQSISGSTNVFTASVTGDTYTYDVTVTPKLEITPASGKEIISVVQFKDTSVRAYTIPAGLEEHDPVVHVVLQSKVPPRRFGSGAVTFVNNQECLYRTSGTERFFVARLIDVSEKADSIVDMINPLASLTCKAKFLLECKDEVKISYYLKACDPAVGRTAECYQETRLCGSDVEIEVEHTACTINRARAFIQASDDMPDWEANEEVKLSFFEKSECTDNIEDNELDRMKEFCTKDFVGAAVYEAALFDANNC